jgi:hypothetical protein
LSANDTLAALNHCNFNIDIRGERIQESGIVSTEHKEGMKTGIYIKIMKREKDIKTCVYDIYSSIRRSIRETLSAREMSSAKWRIRSSLFLNKNVFRSLFAFEMAVETVRLPSRKLCLRQNGRKERKSGSFLESTVRLRDDSLVGKKDGVSPLEK